MLLETLNCVINCKAADAKFLQDFVPILAFLEEVNNGRARRFR